MCVCARVWAGGFSRRPCGTMGWKQAAHAAYYGMVGLQHRGQEGAGMVTGTIGHGSEKGLRSQKVPSKGTLCSKYTKTLNFENIC
jgi:hypothetical protein